MAYLKENNNEISISLKKKLQNKIKINKQVQ